MPKSKMPVRSSALLLACSAFVGCGGSSSIPVVVASDYAVQSHWLSLPVAPWKDVDVFYVYPTVYRAGATDPNLASIDNAGMVAGANVVLAMQATAFAATANLYAPYYRQADAVYALALAPADRDALIAGAPTVDVTAAFDYYITHYNTGRPFILAGHSQGSQVLLGLLSGYMKQHPDVYSRMVAAYVVGYSVTSEYLAANPYLKFAQGPGDTGVIISYNTQAPIISAANPVVTAGALVINPISWTREETPAPATASLGSMLPGPTGLVLMPQFADARVDRSQGVLICSSEAVAKLPQSSYFPSGVYHPYDYGLYYNDLAANAALRVKQFLGR